jgi:hypothetical protein
MGLDAETGVFMLLFLDLSHDEAVRKGRMRHRGDLREAIFHGAVRRIRPKTMTVAAAFLGLVPMMWAASTGADMMKRVVAPMVGGLVTSFLLELMVYPPLYEMWKGRGLPEAPAGPAEREVPVAEGGAPDSGQLRVSLSPAEVSAFLSGAARKGLPAQRAGRPSRNSLSAFASLRGFSRFTE